MIIRSIRGYLLSSLVIALLITLAISAFTTYQSAKRELDELYNANLQQVARVIKSQHTSFFYNSHADAKSDRMAHDIKMEEDFFIRITHMDGRIHYVSHPKMNLPHIDKMGFSTVTAENQKWRFYVVNSGKDTIEVAQSIDLRRIAIGEVALSLIIPQLLFIPFLGLFIWVAVGRSLRPLNGLSTNLKQREKQLLAPLSPEHFPKEIMPVIDSFNILLGRLSNMVGVLRQFTSDAAHELRTPLTALKLQIALVERAFSDEERQQAIEQLKAGIDRSIMLVQQLLSLARMEPGAIHLVFEPVDLAKLFSSAIQSFMPMTNAKGITLKRFEQEPAILNGNRESLVVLLNNLLDNAIRYTPVNGGIFTHISTDHDTIRLEIRNTGDGIRPEESERIFDRFYRGAVNETSGSGLGLSIVKQIADQHDAVIRISSDEVYNFIITILFQPIGK